MTLLNGSATSTAPRPASSGEPAAAQEPTNAGRLREGADEAAPALKGPSRRGKVSTAKAEADRAEFNERAGDGTPNKAMRPDATGSESPAGKTDGGKATGKATRSPAGDGAGAAGTAPQAPGTGATPESVSDLKPTAEKAPRKPRKKKGE